MPPKSLKAFICYRRADSQGHAGRLSDAFANKYGRQFIFKDVTNIKAGVYFPEIVESAITNSSILVVIIGPGWRGKRFLRKARIFDSADWTRREIETAIKTGTHILPVLVNNGKMPSKNDLPESLHQFADLNAISLTDERWEQDIEDVYAEAEHLAQLPPLSLPKESEVSDTEQKKRSFKPMLAGGILVLVALISFLVIKFSPANKPGTGQPPVGDWRSKVVMVQSGDDNSNKSTGFFVSKKGLVMAVTTGALQDSGWNIVTSDKKKYPATIAARTDGDRFTLLLLKSTLTNTPFYKVDARIPQKNMSIQIPGVYGESFSWKIYTARVLTGDANEVKYERPENTWEGMMGSPVIDVNDDVAFAVHTGSELALDTISISPNLAQGICFSRSQLDILFKNYKNQ